MRIMDAKFWLGRFLIQQTTVLLNHQSRKPMKLDFNQILFFLYLNKHQLKIRCCRQKSEDLRSGKGLLKITYALTKVNITLQKPCNSSQMNAGEIVHVPIHFFLFTIKLLPKPFMMPILLYQHQSQQLNLTANWRINKNLNHILVSLMKHHKPLGEIHTVFYAEGYKKWYQQVMINNQHQQ